MTIVGAFAFGDFVFEPWNAAGLSLSMSGAVWYATRSAMKVRARAHAHAAGPTRVGSGRGVGAQARVGTNALLLLLPLRRSAKSRSRTSCCSRHLSLGGIGSKPSRGGCCAALGAHARAAAGGPCCVCTCDAGYAPPLERTPPRLVPPCSAEPNGFAAASLVNSGFEGRTQSSGSAGSSSEPGGGAQRAA